MIDPDQSFEIGDLIVCYRICGWHPNDGPKHDPFPELDRLQIEYKDDTEGLHKTVNFGVDDNMREYLEDRCRQHMETLNLDEDDSDA